MLRPEELTAARTVAAIRTGRLDPLEAVEAALAQAEAKAHLGAFIQLTEEPARAAAKKLAERIAAGSPPPPLAGLPIAVKDNIDLAGLPTTGATPALRAAYPKATAPVLRTLLEAGAIPIGKTNLHELAFGTTTVHQNSFVPTARNPYDPSRVAGGSSGGTAVAVAARIVPAGLGTDTGGSIRIPAALCGIAGLRPSVGDNGAQRRWGVTGVLPLSSTRDTIGPMARTVADLALIDAAVTAAAPVQRPTDLAGTRLGVPAHFWANLDPEVEGVARGALDRLADAGADLVEADIPDLAALIPLASAPVVYHETARDIPAYFAQSGIEGADLDKIVAEAANPGLRDRIQMVLEGDHGQAYAEAMSVHRPEMQARYRDYFAKHRLTAMVFPTTTEAALPITELEQLPGERPPHYLDNTNPGSAVGVPGLSLFGGMTQGGLPVGIELDGPVGSDHVLLALGIAVEEVLGTAPAPSA